jgi:hypothetical protein
MSLTGAPTYRQFGPFNEQAPANTWSPRDVASLVERLGGAIVGTYSQSGSQGHDVEGGKLDLLKGLITTRGVATTRGSVSSAKMALTPSTLVGRWVKEPQRRTTSNWMTRRTAGNSTASRT